MENPIDESYIIIIIIEVVVLVFLEFIVKNHDFDNMSPIQNKARGSKIFEGKLPVFSLSEVSEGNNMIQIIEEHDVSSKKTGSSITKEGQEVEGCTFAEAKEKRKQLWKSYLIVYITARVVIWVKSPYIILNYIEMGFSIQTISILYMVDLLSATLLSILIGNLSDRIGRKYACTFYFIFSAMDLGLKYLRNIPGVYISQILNGITTVMIHNSFESWINLEAIGYFSEDEKDRKIVFLANLFKDASYFDSLGSVLSALFTVFVYVSILLKIDNIWSKSSIFSIYRNCSFRGIFDYD